MIGFLSRTYGLGKLGYQFRVPSGIGAAILIIAHHYQNNVAFTWVDYLTIVIVLSIPHIYLIWYIKSGNDKGLAFKQIKYDLFLCGFIAGAMEITLIPSVIYCLAILTTYVAARGLNKIYRILLIPAGAFASLALQGFHIHLQSTEVMNYMSLVYGVVHFSILSYVSYIFARHQYNGKKIIAQQNKDIDSKNEEISQQAEELKSLNESLQSLNRNLEQKVSERTSELELKNEKLSEYAFINAHKLRAPVASILGLVELFDYKQVLSNNGDEIAQRLKDSASELNIIVKEIRERLEKEGLKDTPLNNDDLSGQ